MTEDVKHPKSCGATFGSFDLITTSAINVLSSFDLEADQVSIAADVKVVVLDVAQPVVVVHHGAVRKPDVELLHVEGDAALKGDTRL